MQSIKDANLSGSDILKNSWDEICVQVQDEYSIYWDAYLIEIERFVSSAIEDNDDEIPYFDDDIIQFIVNNYILVNAVNYTNKRIEKYLWN